MIDIVLNVVAIAVVILFLIRGILKNHKNPKISYLIFSILVIYAIYLILQIMWLYDIYHYTDSDLLSLVCLISIAQSFVFYLFSTSLRKSKFSHYFFALYVLAIALISVSPLSFKVFVILASSFFTLLTLINLMDSSNILIRKVSYFLLIYSGATIILFLLLYLGIGKIYIFVPISNILFIFVAYFLSGEYPIIIEPENTPKKDKNVVIIFLKYLIFISALTNIILISTLSIHELSHVLVARFYDCDAKAIFFEKGLYPYSQINCNGLTGNSLLIIALAGPVVPILLALLMFFLEKTITRAIALLVIGFNLLSGYKDFVEIQISDSLILVITLTGAALLLLGLYYLARFIFYQEKTYNHNKGS